MIHSVDECIIQKLFSKLSMRYGFLWTSRLGDNGNWKDCENEWLEELSKFNLIQLKDAVKKALFLYKEFPPTLGQLINLCLKASGIPSEDEVITLMTRRDFNHPLVKMIYEKIGSWNLSNGKVDEIKTKTKTAYADCLAKFRESPDICWAILESDKSKLNLPIFDIPKIPLKEELLNFNDRMKSYTEKSISERLKLGKKEHPEWPNDKINPSSKGFDKNIFAEYKKYLLSIDETMAITLPVSYAYTRMRLKTQAEVGRRLKDSIYNVTQRVDDKMSPRAFNEPKQMYKNWVKD